ncbi:MAG: trehalose-phosphatase [Sulfobacillus acidophilus]|uniref:Trehalose 6-phosphate phosphatase n=1 Tax=Sulfobacillus acidophilus TaxID=53633 RepID=A0A2T2WIA9_9FIRM|nr:MAG: trehalose-phosphatase [Sulfobacillus acidophilus]
MWSPKQLADSDLHTMLKRDGVYWIFDLDGTLIDLADRPGRVHVPPSLLSDLTSLADLYGGRVAVVSGRALSDLKVQIPLAALTLVGNHGAEWRLQGKEWTTPLPPQTEASLQAVRPLLLQLAHRYTASLLEDKGVSLSFHVRHLSPPEKMQCEQELHRVMEPMESLQLRPGQECWEIRPRPGPNKGDAVRELLSRVQGAAWPLVFGDDWTDEDAFEAANSHGVTVVIGDRRPTQAQFWLPQPATLRTLLHRISADR